MINRQMEEYSLYINQPIQDKYGKLKDNYVFLDNIQVAINFISMNKRTEDIRFKDCDYIGLTLYKGLDLCKDYKLVGKVSYKIVSINEVTRLSQYLLKVVM